MWYNHLHKTTPPSLSRTSYRLTTVLPPPTLKILTPSPTLPMPLASLTINPDYFQPNLELGLTSLLLAMRTISRPLWKILRRKTGFGERLISRCKSQCFTFIDDVTHGVLSIAAPSLYNRVGRFCRCHILSLHLTPPNPSRRLWASPPLLINCCFLVRLDCRPLNALIPRSLEARLAPPRSFADGATPLSIAGYGFWPQVVPSETISVSNMPTWRSDTVRMMVEIGTAR